MFGASGQVGRDLLAVDWASTPLGPPEQWPHSLRTAVRILLTSKFSMWMAWGPELTFLCNDAYRRDTLGEKYPWALGKPASAVWSEIWPDIGPRIDAVMATGEATWDESLRLFLERSGYLEETYHTFSYSPLADDAGRIAGMLCVVTEDTEQVIAARRMATLRDLGIRTSDLTEAETIASASEHLAQNPWCLPFTLTYLFSADAHADALPQSATLGATLGGSTGFAGAHLAAPNRLSVTDPDAVWPVAKLMEAENVLVDLGDRFLDLPTGEWPDPPRQGFAVPLIAPRQATPYGFLVVGLNPYRQLDEGYRGFVQLIAAHLAASLTNARAFEFEKQRAESLAQIDRAKTDFFTNVSHEFRTPLTLLLGPAEDALADVDHPLPPPQRQRLEVVHRNAQRLLKLVNSLLDFSRAEPGGVTSRFEPVDLADYTTELASMFQVAAERSGLRLTVDCPPLGAPVYVDRDHWAKVVLNLLSNALKFTFDGGITVGLREVEGHAELTVSDTGVGVPSAEVPLLFQRFHRVHGARSRSHEGSGIGLALVSELVERHGGAVEATSTEGVGTTVTVRVPLGNDHLPPDEVSEGGRLGQPSDLVQEAAGFVAETMSWLSAPAPEGQPEVAAGEGGRARILVVDDNDDMRSHVARLLAADYWVATARDGVEALAQVEDVRPDLVLTDVMMPRLDGFGLLAALQAHPATVGVPVIMLSARTGEDGTAEGLEAGADDYLSKPFSARELLARVRVNLELDRVRRVRSALERSQAMLDQAQRMAGVGSWEVDLGSGAVQGSEELLRLVGRSGAEFEALGYPGVIETMVHPDDLDRLRPFLTAAAAAEVSLAFETRMVTSQGGERLVRVRGETVPDATGAPRYVRGSVQDVTDQRAAEQALATSAAHQEAASREHEIADELQRSLLPEHSFDLEHLDVATYYRAGVEGTHVGGDWYDLIDLGAGRSAMIVGDVMGRGVQAAASMGQLRSAVRAFTKLDLAPSEVLEYLDEMVQDLPGDQIVTCAYAIFDSTDQTLRFANAGHLPPLMVTMGEAVEQLGTPGPPLGAGYFGQATEVVQLQQGTTVAFYTDGLVERRGQDLDVGIESLAALLCENAGTAVEELPSLLLRALLPDGPDDDVALLLARVNAARFEAAVSHHLGSGGAGPVVAHARRLVADQLEAWGVPEDTVDDLVLMSSELVTNAFVHGRPPVDLRLRRLADEVVLEVQDRGAYRPRRRRASDDDENGRGVLIVSTLADAWGSRSIGTGKSVWCTKSFVPTAESAHGAVLGAVDAVVGAPG